MKVAIIGGGITGHLFRHQLTELKPHLELYHFTGSQFFYATSMLSTAIAARRGVRKNVSALGDLILEGIDYLKSFYQQYPELKGIEEIEHHDLWSTDYSVGQAKVKRYSEFQKGIHQLNDIEFNSAMNCYSEKAFCFHPEMLINSLKEISVIKQELQVNIKAISMQGDQFICYDEFGMQYCFDIIILANGFSQNILLDDQIKLSEFKWGSTEHRPSTGGYFFIPMKVEETTSYCLNGINLLYHRGRSGVFIGNFNIEKNHFQPQLDLLKQQVDQLKIYGQNFDFDLDHAVYFQGSRSKAKKRLPIYASNQKNFFTMNGLYKNGYLLSFYLVNQMINNEF